MIVKTVTASQTAYLLMKKLGITRSWPDFLSDCIRGRQAINGYVLMPCGKVIDKGLYRPVYSIDDIKRFIDDVIAKGGAARHTPSRILNLDMSKTWFNRKFNFHGEPVSYAKRFVF